MSDNIIPISNISNSISTQELELYLKNRLILIIPRLMTAIDLMSENQFNEKALDLQKIQKEMDHIEKNTLLTFELRLEKLVRVEHQIRNIEKEIRNLNSDLMDLSGSEDENRGQLTFR